MLEADEQPAFSLPFPCPPRRVICSRSLCSLPAPYTQVRG